MGAYSPLGSLSNDHCGLIRLETCWISEHKQTYFPKVMKVVPVSAWLTGTLVPYLPCALTVVKHHTHLWLGTSWPMCQFDTLTQDLCSCCCGPVHHAAVLNLKTSQEGTAKFTCQESVWPQLWGPSCYWIWGPGFWPKKKLHVFTCVFLTALYFGHYLYIYCVEKMYTW